MLNFTCFRWLFWRTPSTLKLLNQVRPGSHWEFHNCIVFCYTYEPRHEISNNVVCATSKASDQTGLSLIRAFASRLNIL